MDEHDRLLAWAALQTPWWTVDYDCHPSAEPFLHRQILAWADQRVCIVRDTEYGRPSRYVNVFSDKANRVRDLEQAGFACQADMGADSW